jgi:hypothetical protein
VAMMSGRGHALLMGVEVSILFSNFLLARQSQHSPRIVTVLVLLLVGIVRVQHLYLNLQICKYQFLVLTSQEELCLACFQSREGFFLAQQIK